MIERYWLTAAIALFLAGLALEEFMLLLVALFFFLTFSSAILWSRYVFSRLRITRSIKENRAFCGDTVTLEVEVANKKLLPLLWLQVDDEFPTGLSLIDGYLTKSEKPKKMNMTSYFSLAPYHSVRRYFRIKCLERGVYHFGPATLKSGDPFGIYKKTLDVPASERLIVYPAVEPLEKFNIKADQFFGEIRVNSHLYQDPVYPVGVRPFRPGDSPRHINWRATARMRDLQTKKFDHNVTMQLSLFVDVRTIERPYWGTNRDTMERVIKLAASIACETLNKGYAVALFVNELISFYSRFAFIKVHSSSHRTQARMILEALAAVRSIEALPIHRMIALEQNKLPPGASVVVITAMPEPSLLKYLGGLKKSGQGVILFDLGGRSGSDTMAGDYRIVNVPVGEINTANKDERLAAL